MGVPTYDQFIEPILRYLAAHPEGAPARDVHDAAADALHLTDTDRAEVLPSGVQQVYKNRAGWAHDRLKRAKLSAIRAAAIGSLLRQGKRLLAIIPARFPQTSRKGWQRNTATFGFGLLAMTSLFRQRQLRLLLEIERRSALTIALNRRCQNCGRT